MSWWYKNGVEEMCALTAEQLVEVLGWQGFHVVGETPDVWDIFLLYNHFTNTYMVVGEVTR